MFHMSSAGIMRLAQDLVLSGEYDKAAKHLRTLSETHGNDATYQKLRRQCEAHRAP